VIATPTHAIRIKRPSAAPTGIDWTRLSAEDLEEMPIPAEFKRMTTSNGPCCTDRSLGGEEWTV
jgi:hypothetical protein